MNLSCSRLFGTPKTKLLLIMQLTGFLLTICCLTATAKGTSQITLKAENAPLKEVFSQIHQQSGFDIFYNGELIREAGTVTVNLKGASLEDALEACLKGKDLAYQINEKTVVIRPKVTASISPQNISLGTKTDPPIDVKGRVVDENGEPVEGATVVVKGTNKAVATNADGEFVIEGIDEQTTLLISGVNIERREFRIDGNSNVSIATIRKSTSLNEVVINKGYYTEKMRFTVGNVATIKAADIEKQPVQNVLLALQGRVPGVEITQLTGLPGGGVTVRIQGRNSIESGLEPLIIIDGVIYPSQLRPADMMSIVQRGSPLNYINPGDIESVDVLKDADATAIYGSRAANGAILITTKKGKAGKAKLTIDLRKGWGKVARRVDMMNSQQYVQMRKEAITNDGYGAYLNDPAFNEYWPDLNIWDTTRFTDWQKTLIGGTAQNSNINTSVSGGSENVQYLIGAYYNHQTTVFPGKFDDKIAGVHFNTTANSADQKFRISLTGSYTHDKNHLPGADLTMKAVLTEPNAPALYNPDGTLNWAPDAAGQSTWNNPLAYTQNTDFENETNNLVSNAMVSYRLLQGLTLQTSLGYTNMHADIYTPFRLEFYKPERRITSQRAAVYGNRNMSSWIIEPQLTYTGVLWKGKLDGLLGGTVQNSNSKFFSVQGLGYLSDLLMKSISAAQSITSQNSFSEITRFNAIFGRLSYVWDNKYLINATGRRDGSNKFGDKNKFHNFGSIGLGWIFSSERWLQQQISFLSFGKIRASFGTTGNDQVAAFSYLNIYGVDRPSILYQNSIGLVTNSVANPYLQWEETQKWSWGMDLGFLQDRIALSASFSRNRSSNQLVAYTLPSIAGFNTIVKNLPATVQNISWEFTLNTVNVKARDFSWNSSINLTQPRNKLLKFPGIESTPYTNSEHIIVGQPLGVFKVYSGAPLDQATGKYQVFDKDGRPTSSTNVPLEKSVIISPYPSWYGGFQNAITLKDFQLDFIFQFVRQIGRKDFYYSNGLFLPGEFNSGHSNQPISVLNRWQKPGDNTDIGPYYAFTPVNFFPDRSDATYSYDASYVRLKNLSFSWQVPSKWLRKNGTTATGANLRLYFSGQNLITITKYKGLDPETMSIGTLPPLRILTTGIHLQL